MGFRGPVTPDTTAAWIKAISQPNLQERMVYGVRNAGALAGVAQLQSIDWLHRSASLGVYIGNETNRRVGLGFITLSLLLDFGFNGLNLHRLALSVVASNTAARTLYERLGFVAEGQLRSAYYRAGQREDVALYSLLAPDWSPAIPEEAVRLVGPALMLGTCLSVPGPILLEPHCSCDGSPPILQPHTSSP